MSGSWSVVVLCYISYSVQSLSLISCVCFILEPIVEINATIKISIVSWYNGTPMPMICIMDDRVFQLGQFQVQYKFYYHRYYSDF